MHRLLNAIHSEHKYCRKTPPKVVQQLWTALESIDYQNCRRKFIRKLFFDNMSEFESEKQLKTFINNALEDKLVVEEIDKKKGYKLSPNIDRQELLRQTINDWYCFECHSCAQNEDLIGCKSCFRSFHKSCLLSDIHSGDQSSGQLSAQSVIQPISTPERHLSIEMAEQMNTSFDHQFNEETAEPIKIEADICESFTAFTSTPIEWDFECRYCHQYKYPDNCRSKQICGQELNLLMEIFLKSIEDQFKDNENDMFSQFSIDPLHSSYTLLFYPLDLKIIHRKVFELRNYNSFVEFENDLRHFCHNFCVVRGEEGIKPLVLAIDEEIKILYKCFDCYLWVRAPEEHRLPADEWFVRVCDPPHRLVYAKFERYPFWPSKVIEEEDSGLIKVQFFQPKVFCVATIPKFKTKELDYKLDSHQVKSPLMLESLALLFKHLKNLRQIQGSAFALDLPFIRLEGVLIRKWREHKYEFLSDLNFDLKTESNKSSKKSSKVKPKNVSQTAVVLKESQSLSTVCNTCNTEALSGGSQDSSVSTEENSGTSGAPETNHSEEQQMNPIDSVLADPLITEEDKFRICSTIISYYKQCLKDYEQ